MYSYLYVCQKTRKWTNNYWITDTDMYRNVKITIIHLWSIIMHACSKMHKGIIKWCLWYIFNYIFKPGITVAVAGWLQPPNQQQQQATRITTTITKRQIWRTDSLRTRGSGLKKGTACPTEYKPNPKYNHTSHHDWHLFNINVDIRFAFSVHR